MVLPILPTASLKLFLLGEPPNCGVSPESMDERSKAVLNRLVCDLPTPSSDYLFCCLSGDRIWKYWSSRGVLGIGSISVVMKRLLWSATALDITVNYC